MNTNRNNHDHRSRYIFSEWNHVNMRRVIDTAVHGHFLVSRGSLTWLDAQFTPYWNRLATLLPLWLAPNIITIFGTLCIVTSSALLLAYTPTLSEPAPTSVSEKPCLGNNYTIPSIKIHPHIRRYTFAVPLRCLSIKHVMRLMASKPDVRGPQPP
jgi:hypothetical protein